MLLTNGETERETKTDRQADTERDRGRQRETMIDRQGDRNRDRTVCQKETKDL